MESAMHNRWLVNALAKAFVTGDAASDALVERGATLLGRPWRWLRPLALRYLRTFSGETRPRQRDAVQFLLADEGFERACLRHQRTLRLVNRLPQPAQMQPVPAADAWPLPRIESVGELAAWLEIGSGELEWFADLRGLGIKERAARLQHYSYRVLQKDNARVRLIEAPKNRLKALQRRILNGILEQIPVHDAAHGFRKGRSIQTFCTPHAGRRVILKMDFEDFFPSISGARIQGLFRTAGYPEAVADLLGGLCTNAAPRSILHAAPWSTQEMYCRPHLPQGAPTSPVLANLCAYHADCRLRGLADAVGANYTRYGDDIAFSGDDTFARCAERFSYRAAAILLEEGFEVHHRKTRLMRHSVRQHVAGLIINERLNVRRADFDELKAILTNCLRGGAASQNRSEHSRFRAHLQGRIAFVASVSPAKGRKLASIFEGIQWDNDQHE